MTKDENKFQNKSLFMTEQEKFLLDNKISVISLLQKRAFSAAVQSS